ncbi:glutamine synthetase [Streptomyces hirsutus]|uniref:Glutamine synthetase n=1 Tax=Streptomyces hirsutus TaxID=35620 RepID=A0ABZ1GN79_9ACTN|nr:glutamine synthetase [Streptomyces hirsutus]WSD06143.1 glutamine synthetase [Streptomyces hirsutus]
MVRSSYAAVIPAVCVRESALLWAIEGWPTATNNGQRQPSDHRSALRRCRTREVAPGRRHFLRNKRQEWEAYRSEVAAFELKNLLPVL